MAVIPPMFRVYAVIDREIPIYKTMMQDAALMLRLITAAQMCFYTMLLCAKLSLLTLYRKLLTGLPSIYRRVWWSIVAFCILVSEDSYGHTSKLLSIRSRGSEVSSAASSHATTSKTNFRKANVVVRQTKSKGSYSACTSRTQSTL